MRLDRDHDDKRRWAQWPSLALVALMAAPGVESVVAWLLLRGDAQRDNARRTLDSGEKRRGRMRRS